MPVGTRRQGPALRPGAQERQLGDRVLVVLDRPCRGRPGPPVHRRAPAPPPGEAGEQRDLAGRDPPGGREPRHLAGEHLALAASLPHDEPDHAGEEREHDQHVDAEEPGAELRRRVPERVQDDGEHVAAEHRERADDARARLRRDAHPDADHGREQRVRERREHPAQHEGREHGGARRALGVGEGAPEVDDVLGEREARRRDAGVDDAVDDPVELPAPDQQEPDDERALDELLDQRGRDHRADHVALAAPEQQLGGDDRAGVDDHRDERRQPGTPEERREQQPRGLGLEPVDPEERRHDRGHGHQREHHADDDADDTDLGARQSDRHEPAHAEHDQADDRPHERAALLRREPYRRSDHSAGG